MRTRGCCCHEVVSNPIKTFNIIISDSLLFLSDLSCFAFKVLDCFFLLLDNLSQRGKYILFGGIALPSSRDGLAAFDLDSPGVVGQ